MGGGPKSYNNGSAGAQNLDNFSKSRRRRDFEKFLQKDARKRCGKWLEMVPVRFFSRLRRAGLAAFHTEHSAAMKLQPQWNFSMKSSRRWKQNEKFKHKKVGCFFFGSGAKKKKKVKLMKVKTSRFCENDVFVFV